MRALCFITLFLLSVCHAQGQTGSQNYVLSSTLLDSVGITSIDEIDYYDGLGRPFENVKRSIHANEQARESIGTLTEYDLAGRPTTNWIATPMGKSDFAEASKFKAVATQWHADSCPYQGTCYAPSPINRIAQQHKAGAAWRQAGRHVSIWHATNTQDLIPLFCKGYQVSADGKLSESSHAPRTLSVERTIDEDHRTTYTFTDLFGRTVLIRKMDDNDALDTYFVHDVLGRLRYVLQPMFQQEPDTSKFAFVYHYDGRGRCIAKKLPGADVTTYTYDNRDRLTYSQDGNQRKKEKRTYYLYDALGRLTELGECPTDKDLNEKTILIRNHYDSYDFIGDGLLSSSIFPTDTTGFSQGMLTAKETAVLGKTSGADTLVTAFYYDQKGRETKRIATNIRGGYDITSTSYTFTGKPLTVAHTHTATGKPTLTEHTVFTYDHADRVASKTLYVGGRQVAKAEYAYDALRRMVQKDVTSSTSYKQRYSYNIRDWLTGIHGSNFSQSISYETGSNPCFGGDISSMTWNTGGDKNSAQTYSYLYDGVGRLRDASYRDARGRNFSESIPAYDLNGNISRLQRHGLASEDSCALIDDLYMALNGNQLRLVKDSAKTSRNYNSIDFYPRNRAARFGYDANGNLASAIGPAWRSISYNSLNLPSQIAFTNHTRIRYTYTADGKKVSSFYEFSKPLNPRTDHCANVVYKKNIPWLLLADEGYVTLADTTFHLYVRDHQGNNRMVIGASGSIEETSHYYPFGGLFDSSDPVQPYKYNGKELETSYKLNFYDYGARNYDPTLARWTTMDPMAEKYYNTSSYTYCEGNPVNRIDIDGKFSSQTIASVSRDWYNLLHNRKAGPITENTDATDSRYRYTYNTYDYDNGEFTITLHHKLDKQWAQTMQDVGDATALVGYGLTLSVVGAEVGIPLAELGSNISSIGSWAEIFIDAANGDWGDSTKGLFYKILDGFTRHATSNFLKRGGFYEGAEPSLGAEIVEQGMALKVTGGEKVLDEAIDKNLKKKEKP